LESFLQSQTTFLDEQTKFRIAIGICKKKKIKQKKQTNKQNKQTNKQNNNNLSLYLSLSLSLF